MHTHETIHDAALLAHGYTHDIEVGAECVLVPMTKKQLGLLTQSAALVGLTIWSEETPEEIKHFIQEMTFDDVESVSSEDEFLNLTVLTLNAQPASSSLCPVPSLEEQAEVDDYTDTIQNGSY